MDTIKIIKGVFNNEDIIKDNNAIAAAFSDGTVIGIDTKNDDKFQKDFLSGSGNKDEKEIYISTIDMLTPEAEVQAISGKKQLLVNGVRCKNVSHSDSNKSIPEAAVNTLSELSSYKDLALQMPDSASWNFNSDGRATTDVTFSAKGKSGSVKSTTKHGKFVVTQPIKIKHYTEADGKLPAQSTVYRMGNSSFEETAIQQEQSFQFGKKIRACREVSRVNIPASAAIINTEAQANALANSNFLWVTTNNFKIAVSPSPIANNQTTTDGTSLQNEYKTSESDVKAKAPVYIGFFKTITNPQTKTKYADAQAGTRLGKDFSTWVDPSYKGWKYEIVGVVATGATGIVGDDGFLSTDFNIDEANAVKLTTAVNVFSHYQLFKQITITPDLNLFYPGIYCQDSGWYAANGDDANKNTSGKIYSEKPTADNGNMFIGEEKFFTKTTEENSITANDTLCAVDNKGIVTLIKLADFEEKLSYSTDGNPTYSVSFD